MKFNKVLKNLKNYEAGKPIELVVRDFGIKKENIIKLASNENPYGCSKKVLKALREEIKNVNLYPDDSYFELKDLLAKKYSINCDEIIIGHGSDEVIEFAVNAKLSKNDKVLMSKTTFAMYEIYSLQTGAKIIKTASRNHDIKEFEKIYNENKDIKIIFLCLPNNPLGECLSKDEVYSFLDKIDKNVLVVVDGAYQEFAKYKDKTKEINPKKLIKKYPNTLYLGTFSKAYGLGGLRCGYGIANKEIIQELGKLRAPFNITNLSLKAAIYALKDEKFVLKTLKNNFKQMRRYEVFAKELGFEMQQSYTNFVVFNLNEDKNSSNLAQKLLKKGIIIRDLKSYGLNAIRITIGTKEQNDVFFKTFKQVYQCKD